MKFTKIGVLGLILAFGLASAGAIAAQAAGSPAQPKEWTAQSGDGEHADRQFADRRDGEAGSSDRQDSESSGDYRDPAPDAAPAVDMAQAQKAAEAYAKSGKAVSVRLEDENGKLVYAVVVARHVVKVDAMTGAVLGSGGGEGN
ncbi:MAG: PepSY domain-containing protein [Treponema sp.]|nr:PepSY domain-containing protein [Treponema sp.]